MPWAKPPSPTIMLGILVGRAASLTAAECLFRGTLLTLFAGYLKDEIAQV